MMPDYALRILGWVLASTLVVGAVWGRVHRFRNPKSNWFAAFLPFAGCALIMSPAIAYGIVQWRSWARWRERDQAIALQLAGFTVVSVDHGNNLDSYRVKPRTFFVSSSLVADQIINRPRFSLFSSDEFFGDLIMLAASASILGGFFAGMSRSIEIVRRPERRGFEVVFNPGPVVVREAISIK